MSAIRTATTDDDEVSGAFGMVKATASDRKTVERWAAEHGRNPGDLDTLLATVATTGLHVGCQDGRLVSSVSVMSYDERYAHLGFVLVAPDMRGLGYEAATLTEALYLADGRTIGVDAAVDQYEFFRSNGFEPAWRTLCYQGRPSPHPRTNPHLTPFDRHTDDGPAAIMDDAAFPAPRYAFAIAMARARHRYALVYREGTTFRGYGVLRPAHTGMRIGPIYADSEIVATALLAALCDHACTLNAATITVDVPDNNPIAAALAESCGLRPAGETTRMYRAGRDRAPAEKSNRNCYALTSLELG